MSPENPNKLPEAKDESNKLTPELARMKLGQEVLTDEGAPLRAAQEHFKKSLNKGEQAKFAEIYNKQSSNIELTAEQQALVVTILKKELVADLMNEKFDTASQEFKNAEFVVVMMRSLSPDQRVKIFNQMVTESEKNPELALKALTLGELLIYSGLCNQQTIKEVSQPLFVSLGKEKGLEQAFKRFNEAQPPNLNDPKMQATGNRLFDALMSQTGGKGGFGLGANVLTSDRRMLGLAATFMGSLTFLVNALLASGTFIRGENEFALKQLTVAALGGAVALGGLEVSTAEASDKPGVLTKSIYKNYLNLEEDKELVKKKSTEAVANLVNKNEFYGRTELHQALVKAVNSPVWESAKSGLERNNPTTFLNSVAENLTGQTTADFNKLRNQQPEALTKSLLEIARLQDVYNINDPDNVGVGLEKVKSYKV